jgi:HlyD family secretion protein
MILAIVAVLAAAATAAVLLARSRGATTYQTVPVVRGQLIQNVTASGTVNAQDIISVGTQVSGTIQSLYVDYNSKVRKGQILAQIDPSQFRAQLAQARASRAQAQAQAAAGTQNAAGARYSAAASNESIASAQQDLVRAQAGLVLAQRTLARDRSLLQYGYIAQSQYDADYASAVGAESAYRAARATVNQNIEQSLQASAGATGTESTAQAAAASVSAAQAVVEQDTLNLQRTTIVSPVDGTVVARNVSVGQTVAASFQTPTLFTIARDLRKMEVDIAVGEPDIGNVRPHAAVAFTVLAYPSRTFHGIVSQVRVNPTTIANVVTYTVVMLVANKDNALLPGMTANAVISVAGVHNALLVPVQALQYRPETGQQSTHHAGAGTSPWGQTAADVSGAVVAGSTRRVFCLRDGKPARVPVYVQLVSGTVAAVIPAAALKAGDQVITGDSNSSARAKNNAGNPAFGMGRVAH